MERFYEQWEQSGLNQRVGSSCDQRARSRSPIVDLYSHRSQSYESTSSIGMRNMRDVDFEAQRRAIDLEMKRQDEIEKLEEEKQKLESQRILESQSLLNIPSIARNDLRLTLEESRVPSQTITPPPIPPPMAIESTASGASNIPILTNSDSMTSNFKAEIPGFDYRRLSPKPPRDETRPLRLLSEKGSEVTNKKSNKSREELMESFTKDCDTISLVTQMFIDEDPSLEDQLLKAFRGVLRKVMQKHLEVIPK